MKKPELLVTGAAGWLGSRLIELSDKPIRALKLPEQLISKPLCEIMIGDLRDERLAFRFCAGAEGATIIHAAGVIHPRRTREFYSINVDATRNLLEAAVRCGIKSVVLISSNSVCGCSETPYRQFTEGSPYRPWLNYGKSKMQMEQLALTYAKRLHIVILRGTWFYGPNQPERQTTFFRMVRAGKAPIVGTGNNLRSMTYIDNMVQAVHLARNARSGSIYWIADTKPYAMSYIVGTIQHVMQHDFWLKTKFKYLHLPDFTSDIAYLADSVLQRCGFYNQKIHVLGEMNKNIACSIQKARDELGYDPMISLREGMRRSIQWCLDNGIKI